MTEPCRDPEPRKITGGSFSANAKGPLSSGGVWRLLEHLHGHTDPNGDTDTLRLLHFLQEEGAITIKEKGP